ncbi:DUF1858 domain-containing protein [Jiella pacifica]|uniref:DUF1858 domain-containing protein n=1 Tax=Jiella pacifica TaxID=2696469 RepID=A0A6N9T8B8_9HYPH|nr:DUF1858 domain-containing protein [Jiella pacifica]NDW07677.1 DUF1858 domain-containing protein [Jiella pacifica]
MAAVPHLSSIRPDLAVDDLLRRHKAAIPVFIRRRMLCIGCPFAPSHTIADACREHGIELDSMLAELVDVLSVDGSPAR